MKNQWLTALGALAFSIGSCFLTGCGGGSGGPRAATTPAPSALTYTSPQVFTVGQAITPVTPTVTGTVSSYVVSPALPAGLALNTSSGSISGTPTAVAAQAQYTVTASNIGGATTAAVAITVNDVKPAVTYPSSTVALAVGVATTKLSPGSAGGAVVGWSISPDLPAGLSFSKTDGSISGVPTAVSAATAYTVTASNSGGQATFPLTLSVQSALLLDLGHADSLAVVRFDGTHVFSADLHGHWVLWDFSSGTNIARGDSGCNVQLGSNTPHNCIGGLLLADFAGSSIALLTPTGFEIRSSSDGHLLSTIDSASLSTTTPLTWWTLASDGSYIVAGNETGLQAWSASGQTLFTKIGNYNNAQVFAAPTEARVAGGGAGANVVETIAVATGNSSISASYQGAFKTWFGDGARFLTAINNTVLTYSSVAVQQDVTTVSSATGLAATGTWFSTYDGTNLNIYKVGASMTPAATYALGANYTVVASANTLGLLSAGTTSVIDLSGTAPVKVDHAMPVGFGTAYAAQSATQWLVGNRYGVLLDGSGLPTTPRYLALGTAWSIAGSTNRIAISTAAGRVFYYDADSKSLQGEIAGLSSKLALSSDGTVLAALGDTLIGAGTPDYTLNVYSLPAQSVLATWPGAGVPYPADLGLSASGTVLGVGLSNGPRTAYAIPGSAVVWSDSGLQTPPLAILISPDGSLIAAPQPVAPSATATVGTTISKNGVLVTAVTGAAVGWIDNGHLLVNNFVPGHVFIPPSSARISPNIKLIYVDPEYTGASIFDASGNLLASAPLPEVNVFQPLTADTIYSPEWNSIFSVTTGAKSWSSGDDSSRGVGAIAGSNVVFASGAQVLALTH